jgi:hypothetical protein
MASPKPMPVLDYDRGASLNDQRGARLIVWYWLGNIAAIMAFSVLLFREQPNNLPTWERIRATALPLAMVGLFPAILATFALSLGVVFRQRGGRAVHYRGPAAPLIWGFAGFFLSVIINSLLMNQGLAIITSFVAGLCLCGPPRSEEYSSRLVQCRFRRILLITGTTVAVFAAGGWLAATLSRRACEQYLAREIAVEIYGGKPFKLRPHPAPGAERIFGQGGHSVLPPGNSRDKYYPWGDVGGTCIEGPFVLSVEYGWIAQPQVGEGSRVRFFCFFGWVFKIETQREWIT